jgi:hypothetical protein
MSTTAVLTLITLAGLLLLCRLYMGYRIDELRQQLFATRDHLFDLALQKKVRFEDPAYGILRTMINGYIRFAHRLTPMAILVYYCSERRDKEAVAAGKSLGKSFDEALGRLPEEGRQAVLRVHEGLHFFVVRHLVLRSLLLTGSLLVLLVLALCKRSLAAAKEALAVWAKSFYPKLLMDAVATAEGERARAPAVVGEDKTLAPA